MPFFLGFSSFIEEQYIAESWGLLRCIQCIRTQRYSVTSVTSDSSVTSASDVTSAITGSPPAAPGCPLLRTVLARGLHLPLFLRLRVLPLLLLLLLIRRTPSEFSASFLATFLATSSWPLFFLHPVFQGSILALYFSLDIPKPFLPSDSFTIRSRYPGPCSARNWPPACCCTSRPPCPQRSWASGKIWNNFTCQCICRNTIL